MADLTSRGAGLQYVSSCYLYSYIQIVRSLSDTGKFYLRNEEVVRVYLAGASIVKILCRL